MAACWCVIVKAEGARLKTADSAECVCRLPCNQLAADRGKVLLLPSLLCGTFQDQGHIVVIVGKWGTCSKHGWEGGGLHRKRRHNSPGRGLWEKKKSSLCCCQTSWLRCWGLEKGQCRAGGLDLGVVSLPSSALEIASVRDRGLSQRVKGSYTSIRTNIQSSTSM